MNREGEIRAAREFMSRQHPRGRRNSLSQIDLIHLAPTLGPYDAPGPTTAATFENLRSREGRIDVRRLIGMMRPNWEVAWNPAAGGGRGQIRTGRNFVVPDTAHPGQSFNVRIHTNDNHIADHRANAFSHAVVRVQRHNGHYLLGRDNAAGNAWSGHVADANNAHIQGFGGGRRR